MSDLAAIAERVAQRLTERGETLAVAESSAGGLISAALLAVPGASKFYVGGAVVYTARARLTLMDIPQKAMDGLRSASEPYAVMLARVARKNLKATWGLSETGAAGPDGNRYGDLPGHCCMAAVSEEVHQRHPGNRQRRPPRQHAGLRRRVAKAPARHARGLNWGKKAQSCRQPRLDAPPNAWHHPFHKFGARLVRKTMIVLMERPSAT
jgi:nicotinamide-nucleotide amidase